MKCPICGKENNSDPLNEWSFAGYEVSRYECNNCKGKYNVYESDGTMRFTIPK